MADVVTPAVRSRMMAGIRAKNTKPELIVRRALHRRGFRFRLHAKQLPGRPDLVLPRFRSAVFVHGCFWHGHDCPLFKWPKTRPDFWQEKIHRNRENDARHLDELIRQGWRVATVWECAMRGASRDVDAVAGCLAQWLEGNELRLEIRG